MENPFLVEPCVNPELVAEIKRTIEAAFKKDPTFEKEEIIFDEYGKIDPKFIIPKLNQVNVFIDNTGDAGERQYTIQTFISKYQIAVVELFNETFSESIKNAISSSEWLPYINKYYIRTVVTYK